MSERTDTERLDWLDNHGSFDHLPPSEGGGICVWNSTGDTFEALDIRSAIDKAMADSDSASLGGNEADDE